MTRTVWFGAAALAVAFCLAPAAPAAGEKDIVEIAAGNDDFSTLVTALKAAGLVETLKGEGPFTVFAPTNAAFKKVAGLDEVLKDKEKLTRILKAHVVAGKATAKDVAGMASAKTLAGEFPITVTGSNVTVGKARVVKADIMAKNGVVHVIDTVLIPD